MSKKKIGILDYGMGNIFSVKNAMSKLDVDSILISHPESLTQVDAIILPGVGAFEVALSRLKTQGLWPCLLSAATSGTPMLGICLGMQLFSDFSEEHGKHEGMSLIPSSTIKLTPKGSQSMKVPHVGWNKIKANLSSSSIIPSRIFDEYFYFVHSFCVEFTDNVPSGSSFGSTSYVDYEFLSYFQIDNITGIQAHPEKSGSAGFEFFKYWLSSF